jgi:hypothetical protein
MSYLQNPEQIKQFPNQQFTNIINNNNINNYYFNQLEPAPQLLGSGIK